MTNIYKDKTPEQLKATHKGLKITTIAIAIVSLALIGLSTYSILAKDKDSTFISLLVVGFACFAMVPIQLISMNKIQQELKSR